MLTGPKTDRRSNAKNADDLLTDVCAFMWEEPLRVNMDDWLVRGIKNIKHMIRTLNFENYTAIPEVGPACGTVACAAGTIVTLARKTKGFPDAKFVCDRALRIVSGTRAIKTEGFCGPTTERYTQLQVELSNLFYDTAVLDENGVSVRYGTRRYARIVIGRIREFQKSWKTELRAVKVQ